MRLRSTAPLSIVLAGAFAGLAAIAGGPAPLRADDPPKPGWSHVGELSVVATSGNSDSRTFGLRYTGTDVLPSGKFVLEAGALRAESAPDASFAVLRPDGSIDVVDPYRELTAESYFARGRYDGNLSPKLFWTAGAGWEKNEFAGIDSRATVFGGIGNVWADGETFKWRTDYTATYTEEELVAEPAGYDGGFFGLRFGSDLASKWTATTSYTNKLLVDLNVEDTDDLRADLTQAVVVTMSERLALKAGWQLLYDHQPGFVSLPLVTESGADAGSTLVELDDLDSIVTVALVLNL